VSADGRLRDAHQRQAGRLRRTIRDEINAAPVLTGWYGTVVATSPLTVDLGDGAHVHVTGAAGLSPSTGDVIFGVTSGPGHYQALTKPA
jgi:hypothetical protein